MNSFGKYLLPKKLVPLNTNYIWSYLLMSGYQFWSKSRGEKELTNDVHAWMSTGISSLGKRQRQSPWQGRRCSLEACRRPTPAAPSPSHVQTARVRPVLI